jgi:NADP-dependent 3-hydroxy acid dehydrogenase YdfG
MAHHRENGSKNGSALRNERRALVTGGGSGIGRAIALALAAEGFGLVLVGRSRHKLEAVARETGTSTKIVVADLATMGGVGTVLQAVGESLDVIVHCAGRYLREPVGLISAEAWRSMDELNVRAPILLVSGCLTQLRSTQGQVVFINSTVGLGCAAPGLAAYAAGRHALKAAVDVLRQEVNAQGIRVLSIYPGRTDTPNQSAILAAEGRTAPPGSLMRPEDVACMTMAALKLPRSAEVTDITMRPMRPL